MLMLPLNKEFAIEIYHGSQSTPFAFKASQFLFEELFKVVIAMM